MSIDVERLRSSAVIATRVKYDPGAADEISAALTSLLADVFALYLRSKRYFIGTCRSDTLNGLDERHHLCCDTVDLNGTPTMLSHILKWALGDLTLVGSSYVGLVVTGVLARLTERISKAVYLDAVVPSDGQALIDLAKPDVLQLQKQYRSIGGGRLARMLVCASCPRAGRCIV